MIDPIAESSVLTRVSLGPEEEHSYRPSPGAENGPVSPGPPTSGHIHPPRTGHS